MQHIGPFTSSLGLILDIIGVWFLFKFGLPENIDRSGHDYIVTGRIDEAEVSKTKWIIVKVVWVILGYQFGWKPRQHWVSSM